MLQQYPPGRTATGARSPIARTPTPGPASPPARSRSPLPGQAGPDPTSHRLPARPSSSSRDSAMLGIGCLPGCRRGGPKMIIDCAHYQDGRRRDEGAVPLEEAAARCGQGGFVWLGLFEPGAEELAQVRETFGLHELAVEDAQNFHMRPKIELYDQDVRLVILRTARYDDAAEEVEFGEISVFLAPAFVITVRQGVASGLRGARQRLELLAAGSTSALWAILDQVVD